jgi:hypothetical protein
LKRLYGEIEADGLADDVTADWGAVIENSKAYTSIAQYAHVRLKESLESTCSQEINLAKARIQKEINRRLERIPEHRRDFARNALEKVMRKFYSENEERIAAIVSVTLEAFEKDEYWLVIESINDARRSDVETFAEALENFGLLDMAMIAQQATRRLQFLDHLDALAANPNTLEKTIHTALETNLWVLGTQFSLMSSNKTTARLIKEYADKEFTGERANKRPDLFLSVDVYKKYLLIEFKRPSHPLTRDDENQAEKYRDDLTPTFGHMDIIVMGGERQFSSQYDKAGIEILSYATVISNARRQLEWLVEQLQSEMV